MRSILLSVRTAKDMNNKIAAIKAVRNLTGLGLREAKETVEDVSPGASVTVKVDPSVLEPRLSEFIAQLRSSGITVQTVVDNNPARVGIGEEIRKIVTFATMSAQYDIARALLDVMETYCPEPSPELNGQVEDNAN